MLSSVKSRGEIEADILNKNIFLLFLILDDDNLRFFTLVMPPFFNFEAHTTFWKFGTNKEEAKVVNLDVDEDDKC